MIDVSNAKSFNSYVYCQDDTVNLADPDGDTPVMTDDAGHYVYSNGRQYTNKPEVARDKRKSEIEKADNVVKATAKTTGKIVKDVVTSLAGSACAILSKPSLAQYSRGQRRYTEFFMGFPESSAAKIVGGAFVDFSVAALTYGVAVGAGLDYEEDFLKISYLVKVNY